MLELAGLYLHRVNVVGCASLQAKERRELLAALGDGSLDLLIGTHALVSDNVFFAKLGLAVIDEQHKYVPPYLLHLIQ